MAAAAFWHNGLYRGSVPRVPPVHAGQVQAVQAKATLPGIKAP